MKIKNAHARIQRVRKPRRRLLLVGLCGIILLLVGGYVVVSFGKGTSIASVKPVQSQTPKTKEVHLAWWPALGQAAVGSVESEVTARSSDNEVSRPTASMAKVITALAIMEKQSFEHGQAGQSYTLTSKDVAFYNTEAARGGSVVPVYEGMMLTQYQAMQAMLIASGNNMADTLVERVFGSTEAYTSYAQSMLQRMGLSRTVVADASGFDPATTSTPSDLVKVGIAALKNPIIADIVAQPQAWIPGIGTIKNTNDLLGTDGIFGIKTGTTDEAGNCLLFAAHYPDKDGKEATIVGVIMGDTDSASLFADSRELLASAKQSLNLVDNRSTPQDVASPPMRKDRL